MLPLEGTVLITISDKEKSDIVEAAKLFSEMGFKILATEKTKNLLSENGIDSEFIKKLKEGRPNILDAVKNDEIQLIINTPREKHSQLDDSYIHKAAINHKIPYITTTAAALASAKGIMARRETPTFVKSLLDYHAEIKE